MRVVVYVHGLWCGGGESFLLRHRLARTVEAETRVFTYSSMGPSISHSAMALGRYLQSIRADTLHLVGHSMGGLVILELFEPGTAANAALMAGSQPALSPGRIVLTGSPVRGSRSAQRLAQLPFGTRLLGATARDVLLAPRERRWSGGRPLGVIAGVLSAGLGRLLGPMDAPSDGTVLLRETELPGADDRLQLPVSHTGLVLSSEVARQIGAFLRHGRFER